MCFQRIFTENLSAICAQHIQEGLNCAEQSISSQGVHIEVRVDFRAIDADFNPPQMNFMYIHMYILFSPGERREKRPAAAHGFHKIY